MSDSYSDSDDDSVMDEGTEEVGLNESAKQNAAAYDESAKQATKVTLQASPSQPQHVSEEARLWLGAAAPAPAAVDAFGDEWGGDGTNSDSSSSSGRSATPPLAAPPAASPTRPVVPRLQLEVLKQPGGRRPASKWGALAPAQQQAAKPKAASPPPPPAPVAPPPFQPLVPYQPGALRFSIVYSRDQGQRAQFHVLCITTLATSLKNTTYTVVRTLEDLARFATWCEWRFPWAVLPRVHSLGAMDAATSDYALAQQRRILPVQCEHMFAFIGANIEVYNSPLFWCFLTEQGDWQTIARQRLADEGMDSRAASAGMFTKLSKSLKVEQTPSFTSPALRFEQARQEHRKLFYAGFHKLDHSLRQMASAMQESSTAWMQLGDMFDCGRPPGGELTAISQTMMIVGRTLKQQGSRWWATCEREGAAFEWRVQLAQWLHRAAEDVLKRGATAAPPPASPTGGAGSASPSAQDPVKRTMELSRCEYFTSDMMYHALLHLHGLINVLIHQHRMWIAVAEAVAMVADEPVLPDFLLDIPEEGAEGGRSSFGAVKSVGEEEAFTMPVGGPLQPIALQRGGWHEAAAAASASGNVDAFGDEVEGGDSFGY